MNVWDFLFRATGWGVFKPRSGVPFTRDDIKDDAARASASYIERDQAELESRLDVLRMRARLRRYDANR
jgi:hypothetical protein